MTQQRPSERITAWIVGPSAIDPGGEIVEVQGTVSASGEVLEAPVPWDPSGRMHALIKPAWHRSRAEAVTDACELRDARVRSLEAEIARLKLLTFD